MKSRKILAVVLSLALAVSLCVPAFAAHPTDEVTELEQKNSDLSMSLATQGYTLLKNNGVLPLKQQGGDKVVALFGPGAKMTVKGGTGSGAVNNRDNDNVYRALANSGWTFSDKTWLENNGAEGTGYRADTEITDAELQEAKEGTDLAIYVLSRQAGEGADRKVDSEKANEQRNMYMLSALELANIQKIVDNFEKVVFVYNTIVMDTSWMDKYPGDEIDAIVYMANGGQRGGEALVQILEGKVTPSGKLTDTWPKKYEDYASAETFSDRDNNTMTEYYTDGIYVGYRYFDTFGLDVTYPFGYGLSYTTFDLKVIEATVTEEKVDVKVLVTNTGDEYSGKEVVQVYFSAPDSEELEKPYQELAAYGKTKELAPGEKQILDLQFATADMSSYSEASAAYVLDPGQYVIRVGNSSRNTVVAATATLDARATTEQLSNQVTEEVPLEEISKKGKTPIANNDAEEIPKAPSFTLEAAKIVTQNNASPYDDETVTTYLFEEDRAQYEALYKRENGEITLQTNTVPGIRSNRRTAPAGTVAVQTPATGRYVRLTLSNPFNTHGYEVYEFTVYGKQGGGESKIVSQNKTVTTSGDAEGYPKEWINDGDWATDWWSGDDASENPAPGVITIDLGDSYEIDKIAIDFNRRYGKNITVSVSEDGQTGWKDVFSYEGEQTSSYDATGVLNDTDGITFDPDGKHLDGGYNTTTYKEQIKVVDPLPEGITKETATLSDVMDGKISLDQFVACLTAEELMWLPIGGGKEAEPLPDGTMIGGSSTTVPGAAGQTTDQFRNTRHIPSMVTADGPAGVRISQKAGDGYQYCTAFPAGVCMAMTWDPEAFLQEGMAIGAEMKDYGVTMWLAPGMNIHRNALCGRNFEYYSEDPLVAGISAAYVTQGVQSHSGIGTTIKHFWGNNQENNRSAVNNIISERAAREIYLKGFEIAVKLAQPMAIMTSYNENNGWPAADSYDVCTDITRGEWGFKGLIMTDWGGGSSSPFISMHAGNDLIMPGSSRSSGVENGYPTVTEGVADFTGKSGRGTICLGDMQKAAKHILGVALLSQDMQKLQKDAFGKEYDPGSYSEKSESGLSTGWTMSTTVDLDIQVAFDAYLVASGQAPLDDVVRAELSLPDDATTVDMLRVYIFYLAAAGKLEGGVLPGGGVVGAA